MCYVLREKSGFTLFEIMVTISLVVLMLTLSSVMYRNTNKRTELVFTAHQIAAMGRLSESYAASAKEFDASSVGQNIWGLYFDKANPTKVIMFVDKGPTPNQRYDVGEETRILTLPHQIKVWKIFKGVGNNETEVGSATNNGAITVLFTPPDPKTRICDVTVTTGACVAVDVARVILRDDANESVKGIKFNFFGLIDVPQ